jgi:hypothetical protein
MFRFPRMWFSYIHVVHGSEKSDETFSSACNSGRNRRRNHWHDPGHHSLHEDSFYVMSHDPRSKSSDGRPSTRSVESALHLIFRFFPAITGLTGENPGNAPWFRHRFRSYGFSKDTLLNFQSGSRRKSPRLPCGPTMPWHSRI